MALTINRYIHLNPVRVRGLGGHEGRTEFVEPPSRELINARVAALNHPWSSYRLYLGSAPKPGWLTVHSIYGFFGDASLPSLRGAYRRQLEETAALGQWETGWKQAIRAAVLLGSESFVRQMTKLLKGQRNEQTGPREAERHNLDWPMICTAAASAHRPLSKPAVRPP